MKKWFVIFYCISGFSFATSNENNDFLLMFNDCKQSKLIVSETLHNQEIGNSEYQVSEFVLKSKTGMNVPVKFYDRHSDVCMIVAAALPASKENMEVFAEVFSSYDVVLFDYRWANQYGTYLLKSFFSANPIKQVLLDPIEELETVVYYFTERRKYNAVIGLGECYGCYHLAKLQSDAIKKNGEGPFTKLILDSCWYSLQSFAQQICSDPYLPFNSQQGGAPRIIKWVTNSNVVKKVMLSLVFLFVNNVSTEPYIKTVGIPILFVHGRNDLFVPQYHFNKIWDAADKENRAMLLTPYRHSNNLVNKNLYQHIVEKFVASKTMQDFEKAA